MQKGHFNIYIKENIIYVKLLGAFNEQQSEKYFQTLKNKIFQLEHEAFGILIDIFDFQGATPESYQVSDNFNFWLNTKKIAGKAIVSNTDIHVNIGKSRMKSWSEQPISTFTNNTEALDWINQKIKHYNCG